MHCGGADEGQGRLVGVTLEESAEGRAVGAVSHVVEVVSEGDEALRSVTGRFERVVMVSEP